MKMGLLTAVWGRDRLTQMMQRHHARFVDYALAMYSVESFAIPMGWDFHFANNEPLADKWLAGTELAALQTLGALIILGSDDFIKPDYLQKAEKLLESGATLVLPRHIHYYDTATGRLMRVRHRRAGAGRVLSSNLLDKLNWQPWRAGDENIDGSMDKRIAADAPETEYTYIEDGIVLDVKTSENMWSYDHLRKGDYEDLDAESFLTEHFPSIANELLNWNA